MLKLDSKYYSYLILVTILLSMAKFASATDFDASNPEMIDYFKAPPYISTVEKPSVMLVVDNSGSMQESAYRDGSINLLWTAWWSGQNFCWSANYGLFDPTYEYFGYFDPTQYYVYNNTDTSNQFFELCSGADCTNDNVSWSGNFLNWLTMRKIDIAKQVLTGGKVDDDSSPNPDILEALPNATWGNPKYYDDTSAVLDLNGQTRHMTPFHQGFESSTTYNNNPQALEFETITSNTTCGANTYDITTPGTQLTHNGISQFHIRAKVDPALLVNGTVEGVLQQSGEDIRYGLTIFDTSSWDPTIYNGGDVLRYVGSATSDIVQEINDIFPSGNTPLSETLWTVTGYFMQDNSGTNGTGPHYENDSYTTNLTWDPFYFNDRLEKVPCSEASVILITDGQPTSDWNLPSRFNSLDDVALEAHTTDLRPDLGEPDMPGDQTLTIYPIFAFGYGGPLLEETAINGGFIDKNGDGRPNTLTEELAISDLTLREWDHDNDVDHKPDNYADAADGKELVKALQTNLGSIKKRMASGTAASVISASRGGEGAIYQATFFPMRSDGENREVTWIGNAQALLIDAYGNMREDTLENSKLDMVDDYIVKMFFDTSENRTRAKRYQDLDGDGNLDVAEDRDGDGCLDRIEIDHDGDGNFDVVEDKNGDGDCLDDEDLDNDGNLDIQEIDADGDGHADVNEDVDGDGYLDRGEDVICNGILDSTESDINGNATLDSDEDLDGDGRFDLVNEDLDGDCNFDTTYEDADGDGRFDIVNEDFNNNGLLDLDFDANIDGDCADIGDIDTDGNGLCDTYEDLDGDGNLDTGEDLDGDFNFDVGEDTNTNGILDLGEDLDGDGVLDLTEDLDGDSHHDKGEDVNCNGTLEHAEDLDGDGQFDVNEDANNNGVLDGSEDLDTDTTLDVGEDLNCNGVLDVGEDTNGNGTLDTDEDLDNDGNLDVAETDLDSDGHADVAEDLDGDSRLDQGEDLNCNGVLDFGEDRDGDGTLSLTEDLDGDSNFDQYFEDVNLSGTLDVYEDLDNDGNLDINEDLDSDGHFDDQCEIDFGNDGILGPFPEDLDGDGFRDCGGDLNADGDCNDAGEFLIGGICHRDEDIDNDGRPDVDEDIDGDNILDLVEDLNSNGVLDVGEDLNGNGVLDLKEDLDNDGHIDVNEDIDGDNNFDSVNEDVDGDCNLDSQEDIDGDGNLDPFNEDIDGDGHLDHINEDSNGNCALDDVAEDIDGDGNLDYLEYDIDGDGRADGNEDLDGDCNLDILEDVDRDGKLDTQNEDTNGDGILDVAESDVDGDGTCDLIADINYDDDPGCDGGTPKFDLYNEDIDGDGRLDVDEPLIDIVELSALKYLWSAGEILTDTSMIPDIMPTSYGTSAPERYIFTYVDENDDGRVDTGEVLNFDSTTLANNQYFGYFLGTNNGNDRDLDGDGNVDNDDLEKLIDFIRGKDYPSVPTMRSRQLRIDTNGDGVENALDNIVTWRLGDIIQSTPTVVQRPAENYDLLYRNDSYRKFKNAYADRRTMVYSGANDGLFHAFNGGFYVDTYAAYDSMTSTYNITKNKFWRNCYLNSFDDLVCNDDTSKPELGQEMWAYAPYNLLPHLQWLARQDYSHVYYNDLRPKVFDAKLWQDNESADPVHVGGWGTILIGGMRFGGGPIEINAAAGTSGTDNRILRSAYFVLDITDPEQPPALLGEFVIDEDQRFSFTTIFPAIIPVYDTTSGPNDWGVTVPLEWYLLLGNGPTNLEGESTQEGRVFVMKLKNFQCNGQGIDCSNKTLGTWEDKGRADGDDYFVKLGEANSFMGDPVVVDYQLGSPSLYPGAFMADAAYFGTVAGNFKNEDLDTDIGEDLNGNGILDEGEDANGNGQLDTINEDTNNNGILDAGEDTNGNGILDLGEDANGNGMLDPGEDVGGWTGRFHRLVIDDRVSGSGPDPLDPDEWVYNLFVNPEEPIIAAPLVGIDEDGNFWAYFGTGRFFDEMDREDKDSRTYFGVMEPRTLGTTPLNPNYSGSDYTPAVAMGSLHDSSGVTVYEGDTAALSVVTGSSVTNFAAFENLFEYDFSNGTPPTYPGWYITYPTLGERNLGQGALLGDIITFTGYTPSNVICESEGSSDLYALYYRTGTGYWRSVIGLDYTTYTTDTLSETVYKTETTLDLGKGLALSPNLFRGRAEGSKAFVQTSTGEIIEVKQDNPGIVKSEKTSWIQK